MFYSVDGGSNFIQLGANYAVLLNGAPNLAWSSGSSQAVYTFGPAAGPASLNNLANAIFRLKQMTNIAAGRVTTLSADLQPGHYVIICNVAGHYQLGMRVALTVR